MPGQYPVVGAVIVAAGASTRYGTPGKVFQPLLGSPVLEWSLKAHALSPLVSEIVAVGRREDFQAIQSIAGRSVGEIPFRVVEGGANRQGSVRNGVMALGRCEIISVHDGARPGVTPDLIERVARAAAASGAAIAAVPAKDTIKVAGPDGLVEQTIPREKVWQAATPQMARRDIFLQAHASEAEGEAATDDAGLFEALGYSVRAVEAPPSILKLTTPDDLLALEALLGGGQMRIGFGYDIHRTDAARALYLGGVHFPEGPGLDGHSDADVVLHAAADALLGAAALGDIGRLFPNTDPAYRNISSLKLLASVNQALQEAGYRVENLDITLIAERPKISGRTPEMRRAIAEALDVEESRVSVKATTAEQTGPAGRGECMEAHAVACVRAGIR